MRFSAAIGKPDGDTHNAQDVWLLCAAGSFLYALPLAHVVEVMPVLRIEPVAGSPPCVRGLAVIRGTPTPVVDVALLFGGGPDGPAQRLVTVRTGLRTIALAVDRVLGVRSFKVDETAEPLPPLLREVASDMVSAIGRLDSELLLFLGTARVVPDALLAHHDGREPIP
jgi:purine-binding chemotaxis protein CheW